MDSGEGPSPRQPAPDLGSQPGRDGGAGGDDLPREARRRLASLGARALERGRLTPEQVATMLTAGVGETPSETVHEENKLELRRYRPDEKRYETPVCIVYALVNRPYVLDIQPDRSVVGQLLDAGFEVYLVDWGEPSTLDTSLGLADYVCRYLDNCVEAIREQAGVDEVHLLGYCMGGTLALMYTSCFQQRVRSLSLMATPVVFDGTGGVLERWASWYDPVTAAETYGNVPAELLAAGFVLMEPVENLVGKYVRLFENADDEDYVELFARMERWTWDGVDVAGRVFAEFVDDVYRNDRLVDGDISLCGEQVDPATVDVPLLQIVGQHDHIVPPESSRALNDIVASEDERLVEFPAGHVGISVGSRAHEELWPEVCSWLADRSHPANG